MENEKTEVEKKADMLRLSVSRSKTFKDCKAKYKFQYIEKLPQKEYAYLKVGKFVHQVLEHFHKHYIEAKEGAYEDVISLCYENALKDYKLTDQENIECRQYIDSYVIHLKTRPPEYIKSILAVEKPFEIPIEDTVMVIGYIDRIQVDPDGILHVIDYKTSKDKKYLAKDFFQLLTYAYHLYLEDPSITKIRGSYVMIKHKFDHITKEFTLKDILETKQIFSDYAKNIREEKLFRANVTPLCGYCSFLDSCKEGTNYINKQKGFGQISW